MNEQSNKERLFKFIFASSFIFGVIDLIFGFCLVETFGIVFFCALGVGAIELAAAFIFYKKSSKLSVTEEKTVDEADTENAEIVLDDITEQVQGKAPVKGKLSFVSVMIVLLVHILLFMIPISAIYIINNLEIKDYKLALVGEVYLDIDHYGDGVDCEYEFVNTNECIVRKIDRSGYTEEVLSEDNYKYTVKLNDDDNLEISVNGYTYNTSPSESSIYSFDGEAGNFSIVDNIIKIKLLSDFQNSYNSTVTGANNIPGKTATTDDIKSAATSHIFDILKSPDSAVVNSSEILERDNYGRAIVHLDISAQNSFGVFLRENYYVCVFEVNGNSYKTSGIMSYTNSYDNLSSLKSINNFGVDPEGNKYGNVVIDTESNISLPDFVKIGDISLEHIKASTDLVDFDYYVNDADQNLVSVSVSVSIAELNNTASSDETFERIVTSINNSLEMYDIRYSTEEIIDDMHMSVSAEPVFVRGGYIIHTKVSGSEYVYTVTNGRILGFTESNFWTPINN